MSLFRRRAKPLGPPAEFPSTVGTLLKGDVFFLEPRPTTSLNSGADPGHPMITGEMLGDDHRTATSMIDGSSCAFELDRACARVAVTVVRA